METITLSQLLPGLDITPFNGQLGAAPDGERETGHEGESQQNPRVRPIQTAGGREKTYRRYYEAEAKRYQRL